jgi:hypothetical protein
VISNAAYPEGVGDGTTEAEALAVADALGEAADDGEALAEGVAFTAPAFTKALRASCTCFKAWP